MNVYMWNQIYCYKSVKYFARIKFHVYNWAICYPTSLIGHSLVPKCNLITSQDQITASLQKPPLLPCTTSATTLNQAQNKFATNATKIELKDNKAMPMKQDCAKLKLRDNDKLLCHALEIGNRRIIPSSIASWALVPPLFHITPNLSLWKARVDNCTPPQKSTQLFTSNYVFLIFLCN